MIAGVIQRGVGHGAARTRKPLALNITSIIDVVFLLMMYFLLIAQVRGQEEAIGMILPPIPQQMDAGANTSPVEPDDLFRLPEVPVTITVRSVGDESQQYVIAVEGMPAGVAGPLTSMTELTSAVRAARGGVLAPEQRWVISAGGDARWEHTLAAMTALRDAEYTNIRFGDPRP